MGEFANELQESLNEALAHAKGEGKALVTHEIAIPDDVDLEAIRLTKLPRHLRYLRIHIT
jgi:hypothetical protein